MQEDLSIFLSPVDFDKIHAKYKENLVVNHVDIHTINSFPEIENAKIAIIGVLEGRNSIGNSLCAEGPDVIRKRFYSLFKGKNFTKGIVDLGNILPGDSAQSTGFALTQVCSVLIKSNVIPVVLGGGQDLTYYQYKAYESLEQTVNLLSIDQKLDVGEEQQMPTSEDYLNHIFLHTPNYLLNYCSLGHQTYYVDQGLIELIENLNFDVLRLGELKKDISLAEPYVRYADMLSIDVSAGMISEMPGNNKVGANGFTAAEFCQMAWYAGISDKLSTLGVYEYNPSRDFHEQTAEAIAQMLWYFVDGFSNRKADYPIASKSEYTKYKVSLNDFEKEINFYKSEKSQRWWIEVPYPVSSKSKYERHRLIPCSYSDYQEALNDEIPQKWLNAYNKI